jgi:hypothetical protein
LARSYFVASVTPSQIAYLYSDIFAFVSLDLEGSDLAVLRSMAPVLRFTELLCLEVTRPNMASSKRHIEAMLSAAAHHGFSQIVYECLDEKGRFRDVLVSRGPFCATR